MTKPMPPMSHAKRQRMRAVDDERTKAETMRLRLKTCARNSADRPR